MYLSVNRFLKLSSIKKIVRERFLKEYNLCLMFEDEVALPYPDEMKVEMFCGNPIQGYLLDQKILSVEINYECGSFRVPARNYQTIEKLTRKMCAMYSLGKDVIITDEECSVYSSKIILQYCPEGFWICINHMGNLIRVELTKIEYEIIKKDYIHSFYALVCSAWNYLTLRKYINLLIGGESRLMEIYVDGNL
jgi:hypothetical protein